MKTKENMKRTANIFVLLSLFLAISCIGCSHSNQKNNCRSNKLKPTAVDLYMIEVAHQVNKNWKFESGMDSKPSQLTSIVFKIMPDGEIKDIFFVKRSKNIALDESAYNAIAKTNPTKPFPQNIKKPFVEMGLRFCPDGVK